MSNHIIKHNNKIVIDTPNFTLRNVLNVNNSNTDIVTRNAISGDLETLQLGSANFTTEINNVGGFSELVKAPFISDTHDVRTIQSSDNSITITQNADDLDLQVNGGFSTQVVKQNNGTGETLFENTITNNTVSLKSLVAGTGIVLNSNANEIEIVATSGPAVNIYNTSSALTNDRSVDLAGYQLHFNSSLPGSYFRIETVNDAKIEASGDVDIIGSFVSIQAGGNVAQINSTGDQTVIGSSSNLFAQGVHIHAGSGAGAGVFVTQIPNISYPNILYYDDVSGRLAYQSIQARNPIFAVELSDSVILPYSTTTTMPGTETFITTGITPYSYDLSGGDLNLTSGVYTPTESFYAHVNVILGITNTSLPTNFTFRFEQITGTTFNIPHGMHNSVTPQGFTFTTDVFLSAGESYVFTILNVNNIGTQTIGARSRFCISRI